MEKECLFCKKKFEKKSKKALFCCKKCQDKYYYKTKEEYRTRVKANAKKTYNKMKDNPLWKKKRYELWLKWLGRNREKYNKYCLERYYRQKGEK